MPAIKSGPASVNRHGLILNQQDSIKKPTAAGTKPSVNITSTVRRASQRTCNNVNLAAIPTIVIEDENCQEPKNNVKSKRGKRTIAAERDQLATIPTIVIEDENCQDPSGVTKNNLKAKRGKRSLTAERDRSSPLSVKVLRRCQNKM